MDYQVLELLETCHLNEASSKWEEAKASCLKAIKLLNSLSKKNPQDKSLQVASQYCLHKYEDVSNKSMSLDEKIIWLNSKPYGVSFYPILYFSQEMSSSLVVSNLQQDTLDLPDVKVVYKQVTVEDWSNNELDMKNLYQDMLSNCSFVSSLLSVVHYKKMYKLCSLISPKHPSNYYNVQLRFNGAIRRVPIDSKLPIVEGNRSLTVRSSSNSQLLWPALIEKAYLLVSGQGYKFEGSNMAFDTYMLTGLIPEIITIINGRIPCKYKKLICKYHNHLTLGIGTGKISKQLSDQTGYISNHDYVLLDALNQESVEIKNPWLNNNDQRKIVRTNPNELFQFQYLYVNWDLAEIFQFSTTTTFIYPENAALKNKPQFGIINTSDEPQEAWMFLERFFSNNQGPELISLDIYQSESGDRVLFPNQYTIAFNGEPTNSHTTLVRFDLEPHKFYTVMVNCSTNISMQLSVYSDIKVDLQKAKLKYTNVSFIEDEWDFNSCGGSSLYSSFLTNPQFNLEVVARADVYISLEGVDQIGGFQMVYWSKDDMNKGLRELSDGDLLIDFNQESKIAKIEPGVYRIICSCKEPEIRRKFKLSVYYEGEQDLRLTRAITSLGLFMSSVKFNWEGNNRHKVNFSVESHNNRLAIHIQYSSNDFTTPEKTTSYRPAIRASVFSDLGVPVMVNEEWNNSLYGIFLDCGINNPGNYVLLVERFEPGDGFIEVKVGCNSRVTI